MYYVFVILFFNKVYFHKRFVQSYGKRKQILFPHNFYKNWLWIHNIKNYVVSKNGFWWRQRQVFFILLNFVLASYQLYRIKTLKFVFLTPIIIGFYWGRNTDFKISQKLNFLNDKRYCFWINTLYYTNSNRSYSLS